MSVVRAAAQGGRSAKSVKISKKGDLMGVCIIGKLDKAFGTYSKLYSGSVVKGIFSYNGSADEDVFIVTSGKIAPLANRQNKGTGLITLKLNSLEASDYKLCFKKWNSDEGQRSYYLDKVTNSEANVQLISGMAIIPLDRQKVKNRSLVSGKSGLLTYRPFRAVSVASLKGSVCQIVDGNMEGFGMVPFNLVLDDIGKYVLKLQGGEVNFESRTEITGGETNNRRPSGAVIVRRQETAMETRRSEAIAVLNFMDDKVSPALFPRLQAVGKFIITLIGVIFTYYLLWGVSHWD